LNFLANEVNCIFVAKVNDMGTLSGQRVKDAYPSLLKLESGSATSTTKVIEDGAGNDTALKLSTVKVEVNGTLAFSEAPTTGSTETSALFLDASNNIVKRTLGSAAFTSGASLTPTAPLAIASNVISISAPTTLSQLTESTAASADTFLIYDATATVYKYITLEDLTQYIGANVTVTAGTNDNIVYNNSGTLSGSSKLNFYDTAGAEILAFSGDKLVVTPTAADSGTSFRSRKSSVANGATGATLFNFDLSGEEKMLIMEYFAYNSSRDRTRIGTLYVVVNASTGTATVTDTIHVSNGASTSSSLTLSATLSSNSILVTATNSTGSTYFFLATERNFYIV
jgi:hypothetical protein